MKCLTNLPIGLIALLWPLTSYAFVSGSTGVDGVFNPTVNTKLTIPPNGIFNFTGVNIPAGVTVSFAKNADNTPVTILASGSVTIGGVITVNGGTGGSFSNRLPGKGGPGGFDGGRGGLFNGSGQLQGGDGQGPGRGTGARNALRNAGGGGSYGTSGQNGNISGTQGKTGPVYGNTRILPLIGGSGGGGGAGGSNSGGPLSGPGGGGGGGAILIAASGTITIRSTGTITARGGEAGNNERKNAGRGGNGSGGAIRLVATTINGNGAITAAKNTNGVVDGGDGRIRLEAETLLRTSNTTPGYSFSTPGVVLIPNLPSLRISSVGGIAAPANPTGNRDIELPGITINPVSVEFETANVPLGTVIVLTAAPERGTAKKANSNGVTGALVSGTASASINLPNGNSLLTAQTSFTVTAALGDNYSQYAQGERVERVKVAYVSGKGAQTTFITVSGKEYTWPSNRVAMN